MAMDTGFNVGARYGYYLNDWNLPNVSLEADGLFSQSNYSAASNARLQSSSYMADAIYHLPTNSPFELYGGAGLGAVNTNIDNGWAIMAARPCWAGRRWAAWNIAPPTRPASSPNTATRTPMTPMSAA